MDSDPVYAVYGCHTGGGQLRFCLSRGGQLQGAVDGQSLKARLPGVLEGCQTHMAIRCHLLRWLKLLYIYI